MEPDDTTLTRSLTNAEARAIVDGTDDTLTLEIDSLVDEAINRAENSQKPVSVVLVVNP